MTCEESRPVRPRRRALVLPSLFACVGVLISTVPALAQDSRDAWIDRAASSRVKGDVDAPVLIYEIADFQCPYCARFSREIFPRLDSAYVKTGKVRWVFVNLPLPTNRNAWSAAKAALCAGAIGGRFWEFHGRLYEYQNEWATSADPRAHFERYARETNVPLAPFEACVGDDRLAPLLLEDVIFAARAQVSGTPTFIINENQRVVGVRSFGEWQELIEMALRRQRAGTHR